MSGGRIKSEGGGRTEHCNIGTLIGAAGSEEGQIVFTHTGNKMRSKSASAESSITY